MLGRLGMTVDECIRAYDTFAETTFSPKRTSILPAAPKGAFSVRALEKAIKQMLEEFFIESSCADHRRQRQSTVKSCSHENIKFRSSWCTKTYVFYLN
ncbi:hypothetical protein RRF57_008982 [Xylaria bambusicola]|uniref:Uncharacterized protein n=1 Tax=Xylaria bambusicola TaxID=326684 RepID=A0AAN7UNY5_9PEZI